MNEKRQEIQKAYEEYLARDDHLGIMIRKRAILYGEGKTAVRHRVRGRWEEWSWKEFGELVDDCARGLIALGLNSGDKAGVFAANRAEWAAADFACFISRVVSVPVYATNSARELAYIAGHAEMKALFVGDRQQYEKACEILPELPGLCRIIVMDEDFEIDSDPRLVRWADFIAGGADPGDDLEERFQNRLNQCSPDDLATIIYTSGTTGEPKGVMLTQRNWMTMGFNTSYHLDIGEDAVNLAFLPLSHIFERGWTYLILHAGGQVDYCHDTGALLEFLAESRPMYMTSVPRVWEKVHARVRETLNNAPAWKKALFNWSMAIGGRYQRLKRDRLPMPALLETQHRLAERVILKKIRSVFGGRTRYYMVGGAAFSAETAEFFFNAGVLLLQGYGLTECFPICVANPHQNRFGTCGPVVPLLNVRLAQDGEIEVHGPALMQGYYKRPDLTAEVLTADGFLRTGDIGSIDDDGYITILDRKKELIKTSGGKYVAPQKLEILLKEDYFVEQAVVVGEGRKCVTALIVPFFDGLESWAGDHHIKFAHRSDLISDPRVLKLYRERINRQTRHIGQVEQIKNFRLLDRELTQENGELTPTQKVKRRVISDNYCDVINSMYEELEQQGRLAERP